MTFPPRLGPPLRRAITAIERPLREFLTPGERMADEVACVVSVGLAMTFAWWLGAGMTGWAAFTAYVLMKGDVAQTILRGTLRLIGTATGAGIALVVAPVAVRSLPVAMLTAALVGAAGLYGMLTSKRAYAWLLSGITFEMILLDALTFPHLDTWWFARTRMIEVAAGTLSCTLVSVAARLVAGLEWRVPAKATAPTGWNPQAARHAAQAGIALSILPVIAHFHHIEVLSQVAVTIIAVMIVPVSGLGAGGLVPVSRRLLYRAVGGLGGGLLSLVTILIARGDPVILLAGTALGIVIGRHIENANNARAYIGLQFTLAVLVTLVPDSVGPTGVVAGLERIAGILSGMVLLEPVLLLWHWLIPSPPAQPAAEPANPSLPQPQPQPQPDQRP